jgi:hypothetical protein
MNNNTVNGPNALLQSLNLTPQMVQQPLQQQQQVPIPPQLLQQQQRRSYTQQQIREVQGLIEKCLTMYLTKDEVITHLQGIEPYVIKLGMLCYKVNLTIHSLAKARGTESGVLSLLQHSSSNQVTNRYV